MSPFRKYLPSDARMGRGVGMVTGRALQTQDAHRPSLQQRCAHRVVSFYGRFNALRDLPGTSAADFRM